MTAWNPHFNGRRIKTWVVVFVCLLMVAILLKFGKITMVELRGGRRTMPETGQRPVFHISGGRRWIWNIEGATPDIGYLEWQRRI